MRLHKGWKVAGALTSAAIVGGVSPASAQTTPDSVPYLRAQEMVSNGDAEHGRRLVDSLVKATPPGSPQYAEGLYWRATLAPSARGAEQDYRRIVVDYPLSPRVPDALLRMGELESARGDRAGAIQHFQRLTDEHPDSRLHAEGSYWLAHTYFETNDVQRGCAANADALALASAGNVELKNRIAFQQQRCRGVVLAQGSGGVAGAENPSVTGSSARTVPVMTDSVTPPGSTAVATMSANTAPRPPAPSAAPVPPTAPTRVSPSHVPAHVPAPAPTTHTRVSRTPAPVSTRATKRKPGSNRSTRATQAARGTRATRSTVPTSDGSFAVQVAAFSARAQAELLAVRLRGRGFAAHVDGVSAPFRVRIGHYSSRAAAVAELHFLKAKQIDGFVTP